MGAVYLARQERPHRAVAVKVLRPQLAHDADAWQVFLARFRLEADATAALDHANIVPIYEFGEQDGIAFLVMPYLADGSLAALLDREGPLPLPRAVQYAEQAAAALDYAHQHGVVHRDVKPSNLLLHPDGRLLLADFGIARLLEGDDLGLDGAFVPGRAEGGVALTQTGSAMGTPEYMAPEQVRGETVSASSDIYALGIVTYVMLAGHSPFAGGDINEVLRRQLVEPPLPLRPLRPDISPRLEEVIFWALAKDAADRPSSAAEFAQALATASRGRTLSDFYRKAAASVALAAAPTPRPVAEPTARVRPRMSTGTHPLSRSQVSRAGATPHVGGEDGSSRADLDDATIADIHPGWHGERTDGGAPQWPVDPERPTFSPDPRRPHGGPRRGVLVAGVALAVVVALLLVSLAQAGLRSGLSAQLGATQPTHTVVPSPTPTVTPSPTPTPLPANWLWVSTSSLTLGCRGKATKTVVLQNLGPTPLQWTASATNTNWLQVLDITPQAGEIDGNGKMSVTITNRAVLTHQGVITFTPMDPAAGQPAEVQYTASGCP
jgi:serine/threonine protein kinase